MDLHGSTLRSGRIGSSQRKPCTSLHFQGPLGPKGKLPRNSRCLDGFRGWCKYFWKDSEMSGTLRMASISGMSSSCTSHWSKDRNCLGHTADLGRKPEIIHSKIVTTDPHQLSGSQRVPTSGRCFSFSMKYSDITRSIGSRKIVTMQPRPCPLVNCLALLYSWVRFFETCNPCPKNK